MRQLKKKEKMNEKKKHDSRVKTRKGQSRTKMRNFLEIYGQNEQKNEKPKNLKPP